MKKLFDRIIKKYGWVVNWENKKNLENKEVSFRSLFDPENEDFYETKIYNHEGSLGTPKKIYLYIDGFKFYFPEIESVLFKSKATVVLGGLDITTLLYLQLNLLPDPFYCPTGMSITLPIERMVLPKKKGK